MQHYTQDRLNRIDTKNDGRHPNRTTRLPHIIVEVSNAQAGPRPDPSFASSITILLPNPHPTPSQPPAPRNLERRHRVSRAGPIFDIIPQLLATHRKHPISMRTNQRDHFRSWQCGRVPDLVVLSQPIHPFPYDVFCSHTLPISQSLPFLSGRPRSPCVRPRKRA